MFKLKTKHDEPKIICENGMPLILFRGIKYDEGIFQMVHPREYDRYIAHPSWR